MNTATREPDLNRLRDLVRQNQTSGNVRPKDPNLQVSTDREGNLHVGRVETGQGVSKVPQEVFADRLSQDRQTVREKLPTNTMEVTTEDGTTGFLYSFDTSYGHTYKLFAYFDGNNYQVKVLEPELEKHWQTPHTGHLFSNGKICFGSGYGSGMPNLEDAFAKSVLWANGMSVALVTGKFPFSINNV
jgi:hypothetical protein